MPTVTVDNSRYTVCAVKYQKMYSALVFALLLVMMHLLCSLRPMSQH